eukprot:Pgem_evm1s139
MIICCNFYLTNSRENIPIMPEAKPTSDQSCKPIPTFRHRPELGTILDKEGMTKGVEVGVKQGDFMQATLQNWKGAKEYHLVDLWNHQENYKDIANVKKEVHDQFYRQTLAKTKAFPTVDFKICRDFSTTCVKNYADYYFDYIYIDARHDRKGVSEDLESYWPKLRVGGIFAGHDFVVQSEIETSGQDWTLNYDGSRDETGEVVYGAVTDFAQKHNLQIQLSYRD